MQPWSDRPDYMDEYERQRIWKSRRRTMMILVSSFCVGFILGVLLHYV